MNCVGNFFSHSYNTTHILHTYIHNTPKGSSKQEDNSGTCSTRSVLSQPEAEVRSAMFTVLMELLLLLIHTCDFTNNFWSHSQLKTVPFMPRQGPSSRAKRL